MVETNERSIDLGGSIDVAEVEPVLTNKRALELVKEKQDEVNEKFLTFKKTILKFIDDRIVTSINSSLPVNLVVDEAFMKSIDPYAIRFTSAQREEVINDVVTEYRERNFSTVNQGHLACVITLNESEKIPE